ncbi:MAG: hypothetical protein KC910_11935, partial [Candidatus Eremiobacteraeota bacterium]|nr:hypothetical protein [Candidatus Eremiobacteraeota bacterium]
MKLRDLADFLDQIQEGHVDSHGVFTLDWSRAQEKLAKYQAEAPGLWLLKLLQFAVAHDSMYFLVKVRFDTTVVEFKAPAEGAIEALTTLDPVDQSPLDHLQVGVQSLCTVAKSEASLAFGEREYPLRNGVLIGPGEPLKRPIDHFRITRRWKSSGRGRLLDYFGNSRVHLDESLFLQEMGRFAPTRVHFDGRLLNDPVVNKPPALRLGVWVGPFQRRPRPAIPYATLERIVLTRAPMEQRLALADHSLRSPEFLVTDHNAYRVNGYHAFVQEWQMEDGEIECRPDKLHEFLRSFRPHYTVFTSRIERADSEAELWYDYNRGLPALSARGYLSLDLGQDREGRLYLVHHGVCMKHRPLGPKFKGCLAIWSVPEVHTDLSQLQVLDDELYAATLATVQSHFSQAAATLVRMA